MRAVVLRMAPFVCRYDDLHFAKEFVPYSGRRGGYQDVPVGKLSQLECLSVDWFLWAATCSARLDVKLELSGEWPALRLAKSDQVVYKCVVHAQNHGCVTSCV